MSVKCPGCGALIVDLPTRTWPMKHKHDETVTVIKTYACPNCKKKFRTGERVTEAPKT